jgi:deoxyribodipyrimidine photo-lyase
MRTLVWYRGKDLRVADHAPLRDAAAKGELVPLFVLDPYFFAPQRARALPHRMQFLLESLAELADSLRRLGSKLLLAEGRSVDVVPRLAAQWKVDRVAAHRWVEPFARERDRSVREALRVPFELYEGETLAPPGTLRSGSGKPYAVFTAFARAFAASVEIPEPLRAPRALPPPPADVRAPGAAIPSLAELGIQRNPELLPGGERAGRARLRAFLRQGAARYHRQRDRVDLPGTSRLSVDLKFGTLSVRSVWRAVGRALGRSRAARAFLNELVWREFSHATLWDRPELLAEPFRPEFAGFPWTNDEAFWRAWTEGRTGYPLVDASARQLLREGFVHNRARMVSASFLTKHLLIDYRRGEAHYMRDLTDGDWAQNNAGWQWSAGCGCDAQPYFRVFNPVAQGERFDQDGDYVRRYVPELASLPGRFIHRPWEAPPETLERAGVRLGENYPRPVVEHRWARERFLQTAAQHLRRARRGAAGRRGRRGAGGPVGRAGRQVSRF